MNRRHLLYGAGIGLTSGVVARAGVKASLTDDVLPKPQLLNFPDYQPTSMLQVRETRVERACFPVIDIHTHITSSTKTVNGVSLAAERRFHATREELLPVTVRKNIRSMVNLTGEFGPGLAETLEMGNYANWQYPEVS